TASNLSGCTTTAAAESPLALGSTAMPVTLDLTGLTRNTTYYFRVTATNSEGTTTGSILNFTPN
ncbi:MAG: fibronectin type III domain-containing protein, partial [Actinobacteria bacterium]|nr:fibronectin type III domain-containing protein [Actinomycetota bacterium]